MIDNAPTALNLLGTEQQDVWTCIKERLSVSPLNGVPKAEEKILQKKMSEDSLLCTQAGFHHHLLFVICAQ